MKIEKKNNFKNNIDKETDIYYHILSREDIVKYIYDKETKNFILREDEEEYVVIGKNIHHKQDKMYRTLMSYEKNAAYIINKALNLEKETQIRSEELEKYKSSYVTPWLENREADIVYKIKNKNIFFLIEHQSKEDYSMPFRLQEYKLEIKKSAIDINKIKTKEYEIPVVIPIVIYTGVNKWRVGLNINEIKDKRLKIIDLTKYNLIDINEYKKEELLESEYLIDKIFLLEKVEEREELIEILKKVIKRTKDEEDRKNLITIIQTSLREKLGNENVSKIIKEIKGSEVTMLGSLSRIIDKERALGIEEGIARGISQGISQGIRQEKMKIIRIINNMIQKGMKIEEIKEITGLSNKEIEDAKKEIK